jgi:hypothetical protein
MSVRTHTSARRTSGRPYEEAVMGKPIPAQHPDVVLRSQFQLARALLAVALIAVVGLSIAVGIVANDDAQVSSSGAAGRAEAAPLPQREHPLQSRIGNTRNDGGPKQGTRGIGSAQAPNTRSGGAETPSGPGARTD